MPAPDASAPVRPYAYAGHVVAGRYELVRLIASGGMAEVWAARDQVLGRQVAVKLLHRHLATNATFTQRFRAEAIAAARLHHSSIVSIYDTCTDDGHEAIVMELVRGRTLRDYLDQRQRLDPDEVVQIGADVADALTDAHRAHIIHRDVKPANILLCDDARVMVTDFGIAKVRDDTDLTSTGTMLGTVKYLAPEQVESAPVDGRTDIYSLGVVLYECLVGRPPFVGDTAAATALARLHQTPRAIREYRPDVPAGLDQAVMRALARNPNERFAAASDFRAAILAHSPAPAAHPESRTAATATDATVVTAAVARPRDPTAHSQTLWGPPPPRPTPSHPAPGRSRDWLLPTLLVLLIGGSIGLAVALVARSQANDPNGGAPSGALAAASVAGAAAFDPFGGDGEHDREAPRAIDGNPSTSWRTETYNQRDFGGAKTGVGLVLTLDNPAALRDLRATSPTSGWSAEVYVAGEPQSTLDGWGQPVARAENIDGSQTFDLEREQGQAVLLWVTLVGDQHFVQIDELSVRS